jgi:two-component system, cell cycle response regulator CpdR
LPVRILVVDDQPPLRELVREGLKEFGGHDVIEAADGAAALALLQENEIDLVLTNINMPVMDGIELARQAREQYPALKVLFVSGGYRSDLLEPRDRELLIGKPFHLRQLAQAVADALADSGGSRARVSPHPRCR